MGPYEFLIPLGAFLLIVGPIVASAGEGHGSSAMARVVQTAGMIGVSAGMLLTSAGMILSSTL